MRWANFGDARFDRVVSVVHAEICRAGGECGRADSERSAPVCGARSRTASQLNLEATSSKTGRMIRVLNWESDCQVAQPSNAQTTATWQSPLPVNNVLL